MAENERLAVLENQVSSLQSDVSEIKTDVKALAASIQALALALATDAAKDRAIDRARASNGVWIRTLLPLFVSGASVIIAAAALILK